MSPNNPLLRLRALAVLVVLACATSQRASVLDRIESRLQHLGGLPVPSPPRAGGTAAPSGSASSGSKQPGGLSAALRHAQQQLEVAASPERAAQAAPAAQAVPAGGQFRKPLVLGFVVDAKAKYMREALLLLRSIEQYGGSLNDPNRTTILACVLPGVTEHMRETYSQLGAVVRPIRNYKESHPSVGHKLFNKVRFFEQPETRDHELALYVDCDIVVMGDPSADLLAKKDSVQVAVRCGARHTTASARVSSPTPLSLPPPCPPLATAAAAAAAASGAVRAHPLGGHVHARHALAAGLPALRARALHHGQRAGVGQHWRDRGAGSAHGGFAARVEPGGRAAGAVVASRGGHLLPGDAGADYLHSGTALTISVKGRQRRVERRWLGEAGRLSTCRQD